MNTQTLCKRLAVVCIVFGVFVATCESSTFITGVLQHPAFPGKCWEPTTKTPVKPGRTIDIPNVCLQLTCLKDLRFGGVGCISQESFDDNCHEVTGDLSLPFPDCCPKFECRDEAGNNFIV